MMVSVKNQRGVALLEAMIALFLLGTGLLGFALLQNTALRNSQSALAYSQAGFFVRDMAERMQANPEGDYQMTLAKFTGAASPDCNSSECTLEQMVVWDKAQWLNSVSQLPGGQGAILKVNSGVSGKFNYEVLVEFDDTGSGGDKEQKVKMMVRLL